MKVCLLLNIDKLSDEKLLYVGMTRASERLCIHSFSPDGGEIFRELLSCYKEMTAPIKSDILTYSSSDPAIREKKPSYIENIQKDHPNAYKPWVKSEELELINLYNAGKNIEEIAESLGRQKGGIIARLKKLGIISDDFELTKKRADIETKYPLKNEHVIEHDLWKGKK